ncbi:hypothetical protein NLJ89_g8465 [Agrocybe chaxingu]|uniref:Uncharacterized protein n=1 Tax=Agrocybe chaxingu TaxID=84603 RepID=A0A9W8K2E9_9AGAR|nr:hypothetical protein NLJ89_g8465 [Agrocybe chaxingu]
MDDPRLVRRAKPSYLGRNGFFEDPIDPGQINEANVADALERHRRALFVLEHKKREVPDFETMKAEVEKPDDLTTVNERLAALRAQHEDDLERLYALQVQDYMQETMDKHFSREDVPLADPEAEAQLQDLYHGGTAESFQEKEWASDFEQMRYAYLAQFVPLEKRRVELEKEEEIARRQRDAMFPLTKDDFFSKPMDIRYRVARFLVSDSAKQEKMLADFGWAWRQVSHLQHIYKSDEAFAGEIRGMIVAEQAKR